MTLDFPDATPSLTLNFRGSKYLDPRITFERASSATEIDEGTGVVNGQVFEFKEDVPRLTDKGLLIEEARTNLLLHSADFTQSPWTPRRINLTTSTTTAPDGSTNAYLCTNTATDDTVYLYRQQGTNPDVIPDGDDMAAAFFVKYANTRYAWVTTGEPGKIVWFDLINGTKGTDDTDDDSGVMEPVGNGWYRCSVAVTKTSAALEEPGVGMSRTDGDIQDNQIGDSFLVWGAQFEIGGWASSYIPTSGNTVTRAKDVAGITGNSLAGWWNGSENTMIFETTSFATSTAYSLGSVIGTSYTTNSIDYKPLNSKAYANSLRIWNSFRISTWTAGVLQKIALAYDSTAPMYVSGSQSQTQSYDAAFSPIPVQEFNIGETTLGGVWSGIISRISYYPTRVSDDALEALTS